MFWTKKNLFLFFLIGGISFLARAEEKPSPVTSFSGKQSEEWMQVQSQLTTIKSKVENQEKLVENLIQKKELVHGKEQIEVIEELKKAHIELIRVVEQYNLINTNFQTKFPEKGGVLGRIYKRIDSSSLETIENKMTLEGRLQKLNQTLQKQYSKKLKKDIHLSQKIDSKRSEEKNLGLDSTHVAKPRETQVTDQIILQK